MIDKRHSGRPGQNEVNRTRTREEQYLEIHTKLSTSSWPIFHLDFKTLHTRAYFHIVENHGTLLVALTNNVMAPFCSLVMV